jgi:hypothetical protein
MEAHFDAVTGGHEDKKKERRRKSGRPSSMSLSEEGPFVSCIVVHAGNRSIFFEGGCSRKREKREDAHSSQAFTREMEAPIQALCCCGATSSPQFGGCL